MDEHGEFENIMTEKQHTAVYEAWTTSLNLTRCGFSFGIYS